MFVFVVYVLRMSGVCAAIKGESWSPLAVGLEVAGALLAMTAIFLIVLWMWEIRRLLWWAQDRSDKGANKTEALELRSMMKSLRMHELIRMLDQDFYEFNPQHDKTWIVRRVRDWVSLFVEVRVRALGIVIEPAALVLVRFCLRTVRERLSTNSLCGLAGLADMQLGELRLLT